jgi:hypothetical protein
LALGLDRCALADQDAKQRLCLKVRKRFCSQTGYLQHGYPPRDASVFAAIRRISRHV